MVDYSKLTKDQLKAEGGRMMMEMSDEDVADALMLLGDEAQTEHDKEIWAEALRLLLGEASD